MSKRSYSIAFLAISLLAIFPLQPTAQPSTADPMQEAITAAFEYSARYGRDTKDQVVVAQRIRKYIVISFIEPCSWKGLCKDGRREIVYDPSLRKVVLALAAG